jgi:hypothetical protein
VIPFARGLARGLALGLALAGCRHAPPADQSANTAEAPLPPLDPDDPASIALHLRLPQGAADVDRARYAAAVVRGRTSLGLFALAHGWRDHARAPTFDRVEVLPSGDALWQRMCELSGAQVPAPAALPTAVLEGGALLAVTEAENARLAPDYAALPDAWARLVGHEMAHRLHIALLEAEGRTEEAMGPRWFYEGFAVLASGQDFDVHADLAYADAAAALAGAADASDPAHAYRRYAAALRYFAARAPLPELVARAGEPGFEDWLRTL